MTASLGYNTNQHFSKIVDGVLYSIRQLFYMVSSRSKKMVIFYQPIEHVITDKIRYKKSFCGKINAWTTLHICSKNYLRTLFSFEDDISLLF